MSQPVANRHSRSAPPRSRSADIGTQPNKSGAAPSMHIFLRFLYGLELSSRYSLVHVFPTASSKSAPNASVFDSFYVKSSSPLSLAHIFPTSSSKSAFDPFQVRLAAAAVLCIFCRRLSQIRGNRHPTSATAEATLRKKHRVSRPRVFSPVNALVPNCYTSQLLDDGWLPWWCGWHDGENAHHDCP